MSRSGEDTSEIGEKDWSPDDGKNLRAKESWKCAREKMISKEKDMELEGNKKPMASDQRNQRMDLLKEKMRKLREDLKIRINARNQDVKRNEISATHLSKPPDKGKGSCANQRDPRGRYEEANHPKDGIK